MKEYKAILEPDSTYHIYNRANGSDNLFANEGNYAFFLQRYRRYLSPVVNTFCYCLLPNHIHLLVRLKDEPAIESYFRQKYGDRYDIAFRKFGTFGKLVSKEFSNLFSSYAQAYNKQQGRKGNLFMHKFKRRAVTDEKYLRKLVHYIHCNPVRHGFCEKPGDWKHSSYLQIVGHRQSASWLSAGEVIGWFEDMENFIHCHLHPPEVTGIDAF